MLIERAGELGAIEHAVAGLAGGIGSVVVVEATAGLGKTALLERAAELAATAGCVVRLASPDPGERQFAFGVIRTLPEAPVRDAAATERDQLLAGAATLAGALLLDGAAGCPSPERGAPPPSPTASCGCARASPARARWR